MARQAARELALFDFDGTIVHLGTDYPKLRADLRHFKKTTSTATPGKRNAIVMGRKTWESKEVGQCSLVSLYPDFASGCSIG